MLIGYDASYGALGFAGSWPLRTVVYIRGGTSWATGGAADEEAARQPSRRAKSVEAFAISGYFGVRNPSHELRVQALVEELAGLPATCGHDLTSKLDAVRRATTVTLNAHLILPLRELIRSVEETLQARSITAPLMVVKGDGSLVRSSWALRRPIETILSGPAASVVGAWHLAGRRDMWVVDVGGTTTDIAALRDALPLLNGDGASVGGWRTMIEAVDVRTTGLGGDSRVCFDAEGKLRMVRARDPLTAGSEHAAVVAHLAPWPRCPYRRPQSRGVSRHWPAS